MICKQCEPWRPTGEMGLEEGIKHLVRVHGNRAEVLFLKIHVNPTPVHTDGLWVLVAEALEHRDNLPGGVYE